MYTPNGKNLWGAWEQLRTIKGAKEQIFKGGGDEDGCGLDLATTYDWMI
jgi:hypothetical protein